MLKEYAVSDYYDMSQADFRALYEAERFQAVLDFLETRVRLELIAIV